MVLWNLHLILTKRGFWLDILCLYLQPGSHVRSFRVQQSLGKAPHFSRSQIEIVDLTF